MDTHPARINRKFIALLQKSIRRGNSDGLNAAIFPVFARSNTPEPICATGLISIIPEPTANANTIFRLFFVLRNVSTIPRAHHTQTADHIRRPDLTNIKIADSRKNPPLKIPHNLSGILFRPPRFDQRTNQSRATLLKSKIRPHASY